MCEALGTEPDPNEMPIGQEDLLLESISALQCYHMLPSMWAGQGFYAGKDMTGLMNVFDLLKIAEDEREVIIQFIYVIDSVVSEDISRKQKEAMRKK